MRYVIRSPLLHAVASAIPTNRYGRRPDFPTVFWLLYLVMSRELASAEAAREEIITHWVEVAKELYFEHGLTLPEVPGFDHSTFDSWRKLNVIERPGQLEALVARFTQVSVPLAMAIRTAYEPAHHFRIDAPTIWDLLSGDGTMRNAPSDVRSGHLPDGREYTTGSRAKTRQNARVHTPQQKSSKEWGAKEGLHYTAISTKGSDTYTRTVLGVDIGQVHEGEITVAMRTLHRVLDATGDQLPVLVYDGAVHAIHYQDLMRRGLITVNHNPARRDKKSRRAGEGPDPDHQDPVTGHGVRTGGKDRGAAKRTFVSALESVPCSHGGQHHEHHLIADDGTVYETSRRPTRGLSTSRGQALTVADRTRMGAPGDHHYRVRLVGVCNHAPGASFEITITLRPGRPGVAVRTNSHIANVRLYPDTDLLFRTIHRHRNQSESFFSWLEQCYYRHDRAQSYERPAQLLDYLAAALLHNAEAWAHLIVRHPATAGPLAQTLQALPPLSFDDLASHAPVAAVEDPQAQLDLFAIEEDTAPDASPAPTSVNKAAIAQRLALTTFLDNLPTGTKEAACPPRTSSTATSTPPTSSCGATSPSSTSTSNRCATSPSTTQPSTKET